MPCRCDGYEVTAGKVQATMDAKVKHLEEQLCNAQSLIHKLMKHIDSNEYTIESVTTELDPALRTRAEAHIKVLLDHKKAEHQADLERLRQLALRADADFEHQMRVVRGQQSALEGTKARLTEADRAWKAAAELKDEDLLG